MTTTPLFPYKNRHILKPQLKRRKDVFTNYGNQHPDNHSPELAKICADQCDELLRLLDEGHPDEAEKLLEKMNINPDMPERPTWSRGYNRLRINIQIAAATVRRLKEMQP